MPSSSKFWETTAPGDERSFGASHTRRSLARPRTARPKTGLSTIAGIEAQTVICAINESRGNPPTVGIAFVNVDTCEAVLCQICDTQTYVRTVQKLYIFGPSEILLVSTALEPKSKLYSIIEDLALDLNCAINLIDRRYWAETAGCTYIQQLVLPDDANALRTTIAGSYFAVCSLAAALKYIEHHLFISFPFHTLRIKYEASEGCMLIDISTIRQLELVQNLNDPRSKDCLFGVLNHTLTPMGSRLLRSNIIQPLAQADTLKLRYDALEELTTKEDMFFSIRESFSSGVDVDRLLTSLLIIRAKETPQTMEQDLNNILLLRGLILSTRPIFDALVGARSRLLIDIRELCDPRHVNVVSDLIDEVINEDTKFSKSAVDLRHQQTFAVKSGVNGLLDVARTIYKENSDSVVSYARDLGDETQLNIDLKFDSLRQYYFRIPHSKVIEGALPNVFLNAVRKKETIECSTMELLKRNQKIMDSHQECLNMSREIVQNLIKQIREHVSGLFKMSEAIALLDMTSGFAQMATSGTYIRPIISGTLGIKAGRHPVKEHLNTTKFVPNDVYASRQKRVHIITGRNMSGKSTYIRSIALMTVMAQIGCFLPATYAAFPIYSQLFARISVDEGLNGNASTFATEMQEMAFILRNVDDKSMILVDELGRGTSTRDGLSLAVAIVEALTTSGAHVWFVTHFIELAQIMAERNGVLNQHLSCEDPETQVIAPLFCVAEGPLQDSRYGLKIAGLLPLPEFVLRHAEQVVEVLNAKKSERVRQARPLLAQRKRRLILDLHEHLKQAQESTMNETAMRSWLKALRKEFVCRMTEDTSSDTNIAMSEEPEGRSPSPGTEIVSLNSSERVD